MAGLSDISPVVMGNKLTQNQPHPTPPHPNLTQPYPTPTPPHPNPTQPNCTLRRDGFVLPVPTFAFPCQWEPFEAVSTWVREIRMWVRKAEKRERERKRNQAQKNYASKEGGWSSEVRYCSFSTPWISSFWGVLVASPGISVISILFIIFFRPISLLDLFLGGRHHSSEFHQVRPGSDWFL